MNQDYHVLEILNLHVYYRIREYLSHLDYIYLMNTSQKLFTRIKFETIYFPLNRTHSLHYVQRIAFRISMQKRVQNPAQQIGLSVSDALLFRSPGVVRKLAIFRCNPSIPVRNLNNISYLRLNDDEHTTNFDGLEGVIKASISRFPNLTDLQGFRTIKGLHLSYCSNLTDVSPLANLIKLSIAQCPSITDVSCLGTIRYLTLEECDGILSISTLSNVYDLKVLNCKSIELSHYQPFNHRFTLSYYQKPNLNYEIFADVPHLSFINCTKLQIFLPLRKTVSLELKFPTVSRFCGVTTTDSSLRKISLANVGSFIHSNQFRTLHTAEFSYCDGLMEVCHLGQIYNLIIAHCPHLSTLEGLGVSNHSVSVIHCRKIPSHEFSFLNGIEKVHIEYCPSFFNCQDLDRVKQLTIIGGERLRNLRSLSTNVQLLQIKLCHSLTSLFGLGSIPEVHVHDCEKLSHVRGLGESSRQQKIVIGKNEMNDLFEVLSPNYSVEKFSSYTVFLRAAP